MPLSQTALETFGPIPSGGVTSVDGALCPWVISDEVPDGHEVVCSLAIAHGDTLWTSSFQADSPFPCWNSFMPPSMT